ncbi:MAG: TonB family protein [Nitrospirota bacterium]
MNFSRYIAISVLTHLLFAVLLGIMSLTRNDRPTVFNVAIVDPVETYKPPIIKKQKPAVRKRKPALVKRRRTPSEKKLTTENDLTPETMFGKGTDIPPRENSKSTDTISDPKNAITSSSSKKEKGAFLSEKDTPGILPPSYLFDKRTIEKYARKAPSPQKGLTFDTSEFRHRGYLRMLKEKIERIWKYPREASKLGISGDLYVKFVIKKDGKLGKVDVVRTSGYRDLDEAVVKALKNGEPYWPLPKDWKNEDLEINGHFIYVFGVTYIR